MGRGADTRGTRALLATALTVLAFAALAAVASADFPYAAQNGPYDPSQFRLPHSQPVPGELGDDFKFQSTPEPPNANPIFEAQNQLVRNSPFELHGVRGAHVADSSDRNAGQAWDKTTGRPDVVIDVLDSGIQWNRVDAMVDLRRKIHLNRGELPVPNHSRPSSLDPGNVPNCTAAFAHPNPKDRYDANGDGVFNVDDYACDTRVNLGDRRRAGPQGVLTPQDLIIAFSDGKDSDHNGYVDDIAGWNFVDNNNDPFDDVQYGHGTGEARDSNAEANNGHDVGTCPDCMVVPLRVGDSFIADSNRFGEAVTYGVDNGASVIQEALGAIDNTQLSRQAVNYAYDHGVAVIASAADEAAQHHNYPSNLPHTIVVNSVRNYDQFTAQPRSYLQFNGCTNFSAKITVSIPSVSCSSAATGLGAGEAGLLYSAALDAIHRGKLRPSPTCKRVDGTPCPITANEVRQLMASGVVGTTPQSDDVDFASNPEKPQAPGDEPSCTPTPNPGCTDPFYPPLFAQVQLNRGPIAPLASRPYPARRGFDQFYGYGRANIDKGTSALLSGAQSLVPPQVEITSPDWFSLVDPSKPTADVGAQLDARGRAYKCKVFIAPGSSPEDNVPPTAEGGDFKQVPSSYCDGATAHTDAFSGVVARLDLAALKRRFPPDAGSFDGRLPAAGEQLQTNGRPNVDPYGFTVKVVATTDEPTGDPASPTSAVTGQDRRNLFLHRDRDMLAGFPKHLPSDGESTPVLVDLNGDNRNELVYGTADGFVHAVRADGRELPGWPVRSDRFPYHDGSKAFASGRVSNHFGGAIIGALAAGDLNHNGSIDVVATDFEGKVYAWDSRGRRIFTRETNPNYSGKALSPFVPARKGKLNRTQHGFLTAPVLADLDGDHKLEIVAASLDRHLYAWHPDGRLVKGYPVEVVDPSKVAGIDPVSHQVSFKQGVGAVFNQGAIVDTPAVGAITGDGKPKIVVGTNEEYDPSAEGGLNVSSFSATELAPLAATGVLKFANGRLYALSAGGGPKPFLPGWPFKVARIAAELLPVVGEGITGSPVIGPVSCPSGGGGSKVGVMPDAGIAYVLNQNASSCQGNGADGKPNGLATKGAKNPQNRDSPIFAAVGQPAFGRFPHGTAFLGPTTGLVRALDVAASEYQGGQDSIGAWDAASGQFAQGFPAPVNDLQFLTGPSVADIDGKPGEEVLGGTSSLDLNAFSSSDGSSVPGWPKLTADWTIANPTIGSFGSRDTDSSARKVVISLTRSGNVLAYRTAAPACSPSSWPRFHHDLANSGDFSRDAIPPGRASGVHVAGGRLIFNAPGDDLLCGIARRYRVVSADRPIDPSSFARGRPVPGAPAPAAPGTSQSVALPRYGRYIAVQAEDDQGNLGPVASVRTGRPARPSLALSVTPRTVGAGRLTRFSFLVRTPVGGRLRPVRAALVSFGGRRLRTDGHGDVSVLLRLHRRGLYRAVASLAGHASGRAAVRVVGSASFTG